jgi:hypothetical protein
MKIVYSLSQAASFIFFLRLQILPVMAAKLLSVIESTYGYPGCPHYSLNIHGKSNVWCDATAGRKSVFLTEYSASGYMNNRKFPVAALTELDRQAGTISLPRVGHLLMLLFAG